MYGNPHPNLNCKTEDTKSYHRIVFRGAIGVGNPLKQGPLRSLFLSHIAKICLVCNFFSSICKFAAIHMLLNSCFNTENFMKTDRHTNTVISDIFYVQHNGFQSCRMVYFPKELNMTSYHRYHNRCITVLKTTFLSEIFESYFTVGEKKRIFFSVFLQSFFYRIDAHFYGLMV